MYATLQLHEPGSLLQQLCSAICSSPPCLQRYIDSHTCEHAHIHTHAHVEMQEHHTGGLPSSSHSSLPLAPHPSTLPPPPPTRARTHSPGLQHTAMPPSTWGRRAGTLRPILTHPQTPPSSMHSFPSPPPLPPPPPTGLERSTTLPLMQGWKACGRQPTSTPPRSLTG